MRQLPCKAIGGACDVMIRGATPDEMGENCKQHALQLMREGDIDHAESLKHMRDMSPGDFAVFWADFRKKFAAAEQLS